MLLASSIALDYSLIVRVVISDGIVHHIVERKPKPHCRCKPNKAVQPYNTLVAPSSGMSSEAVIVPSRDLESRRRIWSRNVGLANVSRLVAS
jgi:hypothetical protein